MITQASTTLPERISHARCQATTTRHRYYGAYWECEDQIQFTIPVVLVAFDDWPWVAT